MKWYNSVLSCLFRSDKNICNSVSGELLANTETQFSAIHSVYMTNDG